MVCFANDQFFCLGIICLFYQAPDLPAGIAEAGEGTKILRVPKSESRTLEDLSSSDVRPSSRSLRSIKPDLGMGSIAERFRFRTTASAKVVLMSPLEILPLLPVPRKTLPVRRNHLNSKRNIPRNDVRTVL